jgi:hypothetical protein
MNKEALKQLIEEQANDAGLWFYTESSAEAYLQQELRRLHAAVEEYLKECE